MNMKVTSVLLILLASVCVSAQKTETAFPADATRDETAKWFAGNFAKNTSYKTSGREFEVSKVKLDGCKLRFTTVTRFGSTGHEVMGATIRRSNSKRDNELDLTELDPTGIAVADHLLPELKYLRITRRGSTMDPAELSVRAVAAEATRSALMRAITLCTPN
jgi:hypothetical protein